MLFLNLIGIAFLFASKLDFVLCDTSEIYFTNIDEHYSSPESNEQITREFDEKFVNESLACNNIDAFCEQESERQNPNIDKCKSLRKYNVCLKQSIKQCEHQHSQKIQSSVLLRAMAKSMEIISCFNQHNEEHLLSKDDANFKIITDTQCFFNGELIKRCDSILALDANIGVTSEDECPALRNYYKCIDLNAWQHCKNESMEELESIKKVLYNRVRVKSGLCKNITRFVDEEPNAPNMDPVMNAALTNCKEKVDFLLPVCVEQYKKKYRHAIREFEFSEHDSETLSSSICCVQAEFSTCVYIMSMIKCGKEKAKNVLNYLENFRTQVLSKQCESLNYWSDECQNLLPMFNEN